MCTKAISVNSKSVVNLSKLSYEKAKELVSEVVTFKELAYNLEGFLSIEYSHHNAYIFLSFNHVTDDITFLLINDMLEEIAEELSEKLGDNFINVKFNPLDSTAIECVSVNLGKYYRY